jgi:hypothetical protein
MAVVKKKAPPAKGKAPEPRKPANVPARQAEAKLPAKTLDFAADAGKGMENATTDDFAIPFIKVLQKGSPEVDEAGGQAIEGAEAGMFMEVATGEFFTEMDMVPCAYQRKFIKWGNRKAGGGFKGTFTPEQAAELRSKGLVIEIDGKLFFPMPDGKVDPNKSDILSDTREHYILRLSEDGPRQAILSLTSTQIKKSKALNSALANRKEPHPSGNGKYTPPTFANVVSATANNPEKNDQGSWYGVEFALNGLVDNPDVYDVARAFHRQVSEGKGRVDYSTAEQPGGVGGPDGSGNGENWDDAGR